MLWVLIVRFAVMFVLGRLVFRRVLAMGFWMLVVVAIYLFSASRVHAQEALEVVWFEPLAPTIEGYPGPVPRGVVLTAERTVRLPVTFPPGAKLRIAASPDGLEPMHVDDVLRARFSTRDGETFF